MRRNLKLRRDIFMCIILYYDLVFLARRTFVFCVFFFSLSLSLFLGYVWDIYISLNASLF